MAYTVQNLEHAVCVFYSSEHSERAEAHKWLTAAQRCPEAWSFVWELLQSQKGTEIQFFAATTLHAKLQRYWGEVPPDNYEELRNRILEAIAMFSRGPKIVLNRLCISLAAFLLQQGGKGLIDAVERLLSPDCASILLELLTVVPEEFNSMTMTANNRSTVRHNLQQLTPQVLELVIKHLQVDSIRQLSEDDWSKQVGIWQGACQCAGAWLHLGGALPIDCVPIVTSVLQVLHAVYWGQSQGQSESQRELSSSELETCEASLSAVSAALTQPEAGRHSDSCRPLLRLLLDAAEPLLLIEDVVHTANEELVAVLYGALVATGECHARWAVLAMTEDEVFSKIASKNNDSEKDIKNRKDSGMCARDLVRLILRCSAAAGTYPMQETHSQLAFGFWFILQDEAIWEVPERLGETANVKNALRCWYEQLAAALLRKSSLPVPPSSPSAEDVELIRCYRQDVADTLLYCHAVLGDSLVMQLATLLEDLKGNESSDGGCALEAVLHAFLALAEAATPQTSRPLLSLMRTLIDLPYDSLHQQVLMTALDCFGTYAEWLGNVEGEGRAAEEIVGGALGVAGRALSRSGAAPRAALALRALCRDCRPHLAPHAHHLLQAVQAGQGRWAGAVDVQVLGAAGGAAASLPPSVAAPYLISLTNPLVLALQSARQPQLSKNEEAECIAALRQAASLLAPLSGENRSGDDKPYNSSGVEHVRIPLSLLLPVLPHAAHHSELAEPLFLLIKLLITNLMDDCIPLVPEFINMVNISLQADPHPAAIDVAKLISLMFPDIAGGTLSAVASAVLNICSEGHSQGQTLSNHAPILDSFYSALTATATKRPLLLQQLELQMQNIIQLGILTMSLPEQAPCRAGCWFFSRLAKTRPGDLLAQAPVIVQRSIHCIGVSTPRANIDNFAELFLGFIRAQWEEAIPGQPQPVVGPAKLSLWLKDALQHNGFPSNNATPEVKEKFVKAILRCQDHKRRIIEAIREFALASRGLVGEYGQMTQPLNSF